MWDVDEQTFKDIRSIMIIGQVSFSEAVRCHHFVHSGADARVDACCESNCMCRAFLRKGSGISTQAGLRQ